VFVGERRPLSCVAFVSAATVNLRLELVVTAGYGLPGGPFEIEFNGWKCYTGTVTEDWERHTVELPAAALRTGANELRYQWPAGGRAPRKVAAAMTDLGLGPESLDLIRIARMTVTALG